MEELVDPLVACHNLEYLGLRCNEGLGDAGAKALARAMPRCSNLKDIDLASCGIGGPGAAALAAQLPETTALVALNLEENRLGATEVQEFQAAWGAASKSDGLRLDSQKLRQVAEKQTKKSIACQIL